MEKGLLSVLLLGIVLPCGRAQNGTVVNTTADTFDHIVSSNDLVLVSFGAEWCRFSRMLAPVWDQLAHALVGTDYDRVTVAAVDCEAEKELAERWGITKYPTIKAWKHSEPLPKEYRGARTVQHFKEYIDSQLASPLHDVDNVGGVNGIDQHRKAILGVFESKDDPIYDSFGELAEALREFCDFYVSSSDEMVDSVPHTPHIEFRVMGNEEVFRALDPDTFSSEELLEWATERCQPLVDEITFETGEELTEEGLPFFIMFTDPNDTDSRRHFSDVIKSDVAHERSRIRFLVADGHQFEYPLLQMGKTRQDLPVIAIDSFKHMYDFGPIDDLDKPGRVQQFINDLFSGKLHDDFHNKHHELPPPSELQKLAPSKKRYSFLRDEL